MRAAVIRRLLLDMLSVSRPAQRVDVREKRVEKCVACNSGTVTCRVWSVVDRQRHSFQPTSGAGLKCIRCRICPPLPLAPNVCDPMVMHDSTVRAQRL